MTTDTVADILLVENNPRDAELTLLALDECGLMPRVLHVSDGQEALDYIGSTGVYARDQSSPLPKVILLDLGLHKVGGLQVLQQIKADPRTRSIPVVVLTSSAIAIERVESYKLGVNSYVIKPTDSRKFAKVVAEIGHYWLSVNEPPPL